MTRDTGQATTVVVPPEQADITRPAGAIISIDPDGGATVNSDASVTFLVNPATEDMPAPPNPGTVEALTDRLLSNNPGTVLQTLPRTTVATVAKQCLRFAQLAGLDGLDRCSSLPIYPPAYDQRTVTNHELEAILGLTLPSRRPTGRQPFMLNYRDGGWSSGFLDEWCGKPRPSGKQCDEYPMGTTYQGGVEPPTYDASAKLVPQHDNSVQGGKYGAFLSTCNLRRFAPSPPVLGLQSVPTNPARIPTTPPFLVIPVPFIAETATKLCNDGIARP